MKRSIRIFSVLSVALLSLVLSASAKAQGPVARSGDISANIGFNNLTGIDNNKHVEFGFAGGYNILKQLEVAGEFNFLPQGSENVSGISVHANYQLYGASVRYTPVSIKRVSPYIVYGQGYARVAASASFGGAHGSSSLNGSYFGFGGGASIYADRNWGLRPEIRWDRQLYSQNGQHEDQNDVRGMISVFYQWGGTETRRNSSSSR